MAADEPHMALRPPWGMKTGWGRAVHEPHFCGATSGDAARTSVLYSRRMGKNGNENAVAGWMGRKIGDSPLSPRGANPAPWDRVGSPQFFAGSAVFEGARATREQC